MHLVEGVDIVQEVLLDVDLLQVEEEAGKLLDQAQIVELPIGQGDDVRVPRMLRCEVLNELLVSGRIVAFLVVARGVLLGLLLAPVPVELFERASRGV